MSIRLRAGHRVFIYEEPIDMRAGFNRLSMYVRDKMKKDLLEGDLFLFLGKNRKRLKAICFDGTGLLLIAKRLERGTFMSVANIEHFEITEEELDQILSGSVIRRRIFGSEALTLSRGSCNDNFNATLGTRDEHRSFENL